MSSPPFELAGFLLSAVLYAGVGLAAAESVARGRRYAHTRLLILMGLGFLLQSAALYARGLRFGGCPLGNTFEVLQFLAWSIILFYFVFGPTFRVSLLGLFSSALAGIMAVASLIVPAWDESRRPPLFGGNPWVETHASLALISYGAFGVLALMGTMHLLQHRALKHKQSRGLFAFLPSIVQLELMSRRVLAVGLGGLTLALAIAFAGGLNDPEMVPRSKLVAVILVWLAGLILIWARSRKVIHGPRASWAGIALFLLALASLIPVGHTPPTAKPLHGAGVHSPAP